jgi:NAD(P)-dependent dehydrogenase (short-subunit alcohol dehydrogenase family)
MSAISPKARAALVVGGTSGIGHGIALTLARAGNDVTIAGRSATAGQAICEAMKEASPSNTYKFEKVSFLACLLPSFRPSVLSFPSKYCQPSRDTFVAYEGRKDGKVP